MLTDGALSPLALSVLLASATVLVSLIVAVPVAAWLMLTRSRLRWVAEVLVMLPLALPPTVVGFYALITLAPTAPLGRLLAPLLGQIPFTFTGLVIVSFIINIPFAVRPLAAAFAAVPSKYIETALTLDASRWRLLVRILLPLSRPGLAAAALLVAVHTLGEFGAAMMMGGAIPGRTRTLAVSLYHDVQALEYASAHATAAVMLLMSIIAITLVVMVSPRRGGV
jgi:molybdate transport system permease protein